MTTISIRTANLNDLETLLEFEQGVIKAERPMDSFLREGTLSYYNIPELITAKNSHLIVAVANKELVGSGYLKIEDSNHYHKNPKHGYIGFIIVKPTFRGQRISNLILESLKNGGKKKT
jgi:predicted GNAT family N-acyltransferase